MLIADTGYWITEPGEPAGHFFDAGLATSLQCFLQLHGGGSLLDLGCGDGRYVRFLRAAGLQANGVDGNPQTTAIAGEGCEVHDLTAPLPAYVVADWTLSVEVGEHIPARHEFAFWANLHRSNRRGLIISWAARGQGGTGHVNCRDGEEILDLAGLLGYCWDAEATTYFRRAARLRWLRNNLLVFRR
jgi:SAM-dependent methyltransferase